MVYSLNMFFLLCPLLQAEGFALLSCQKLLKLNERTVSAEVRETVDRWAADDACGKATATAVNAFRDAFLYPEGQSCNFYQKLSGWGDLISKAGNPLATCRRAFHESLLHASASFLLIRRFTSFRDKRVS